jgi:virulence-associated protein VagC
MVPVEHSWTYYFEHGHPVSEDRMREREQPAPQERPAL